MWEWTESIRDSWDKLSDRERRLLSITGAVLLLVVMFGVVWSTTSAVAEVEEERDAIRQVLADIDRSADMLAKRDRERRTIEERYRNRAPALAAYLESRAKDEGLEVRQVLEEPEKSLNGYRRQSVRMSFNNVALRPVMHLLTSIAEEPSPMSIERVLIEHYSAGDTYKIDVGIASYESPKGKSKGATP
jgi:general secretion pathway protein M